MCCLFLFTLSRTKRKGFKATYTSTQNPYLIIKNTTIMDLRLALKKEWFDMTKQEKTEDYREITAYWAKRLIVDLKALILKERTCFSSFISDEDAYIFLTNRKDELSFKDFKENIITLGYPKKSDKERILKFKHKGIEIRKGNQKWGAEKDKLYFVIKHGEVIPF